jgi:hypothetical protein
MMLRIQLDLKGKVKEKIDFCAMATIVLLLFVLQPFLTLLLMVFLGLTKELTSRKFVYLIAFMGSCYLGLINTTKLPDSDLLNYLDWYRVAQNLHLVDYLTINPREPLYFISLYGIANLPFSSPQLFIFFSTLVSYFIFLIAIIRTSIHLGLREKLIIGLIILFLFFAPLFSLSAHLMRQFLAGTIIVLFFSEYIISGKRKWLILLSAVLVHYSSIIFIPIVFLKKIRMFSSSISLVLCISALALMYFISKGTAHLFNNIPVLGFVLDRISAEDGAELGALSLQAILMALISAFISFLNIRCIRRPYASHELWVINLSVIAIVVIALFANIQTQLSEIALRFFFYIYFLLGLSLPIYMASRKSSARFLPVILLIEILFFAYKLQFGEWVYAPLNILLFAPSWLLWPYHSLA